MEIEFQKTGLILEQSRTKGRKLLDLEVIPSLLLNICFILAKPQIILEAIVSIQSIFARHSFTLTRAEAIGRLSQEYE